MNENSVSVFDAAVDAALEAAREGTSDLVRRLADVDAAFAQAAGQAGEEDALRQRIRERVLPVLRKEHGLVAKLNFAASLTGSGNQGPFFRAARSLCAERARELPAEELPGIVESFRRQEKYREMDFFAQILFEKTQTGPAPSPESLRLRSKLHYELSMAVYQHAMKGPDASAATQYKEAVTLARQSAEEAMAGGDPIGKLFALMNVSGLFLPKLRKWNQALEISAQIGADAAKLAQAATDDDSRNRAFRVLMNSLFHRINISVEFGGNAADVKVWLDELEPNPIYQASKEQEWAVRYVAAARAFIAEHS
jgi:hypothetical protein